MRILPLDFETLFQIHRIAKFGRVEINGRVTVPVDAFDQAACDRAAQALIPVFAMCDDASEPGRIGMENSGANGNRLAIFLDFDRFTTIGF